MTNNFVFFYVDTDTDYKSNIHKSIERGNIELFIKSIKKYHPDSCVIHCTNYITKSFKNSDKVHREDFDLNDIMVGKIKCFSSLKIETTSVYLDPDMLIMKTIPIKQIENKADVFLLKRSFNLDQKIPVIFRKLKFQFHKNKLLDCLHHFILVLLSIIKKRA